MSRWQLLVCLFLILCLSPAITAQSELPTIAGIIAEDERFTVLQRMLDMADPNIYAYINDPKAQLSFFAPTNEAMEEVFGKTRGAQEAYADAYPYRVNEIIRLHIIPAAIDFTRVRYPKCRTIGTMLINTQQYVWMDDEFLNINQVPIEAKPLSARNGYLYPIELALPKLYVDPRSGDHTPDEQKRPKPLAPHFGDIYPDAPLNIDTLSTEDVKSVLAADGRFSMFLRLLDAAPQYRELIESGGVYTLFIPTDTAIQTYFEASQSNADTLSPGRIASLVAQRILPGYMTPDYINFASMWSNPVELCTVDWLVYDTVSGDATMEVIDVDFDRDAGLTANGGAFSESPLYARNAIIYVTEEFYPSEGLG